jgi:c-di-GMP-binding flagellar brake protein YcgR
MPEKERRRAPRTETKLLVSYRAQVTEPTPAGFVRSLNLSEQGMLLESPDRFEAGQLLTFEILLDYDLAAWVRGKVLRVQAQPDGSNRVAVEFENVSPETQKILKAQSAA